VRSFFGAATFASSFLVAAVLRGADGAPVILAMLDVTLDTFFVFLLTGNPVSMTAFFLAIAGFFFAAMAGGGWTGNGD